MLEEFFPEFESFCVYSTKLYVTTYYERITISNLRFDFERIQGFDSVI